MGIDEDHASCDISKVAKRVTVLLQERAVQLAKRCHEELEACTDQVGKDGELVREMSKLRVDRLEGDLCVAESKLEKVFHRLVEVVQYIRRNFIVVVRLWWCRRILKWLILLTPGFGRVCFPVFLFMAIVFMGLSVVPSTMFLELPWVIDIGCLSEIGAVIFWTVTSWSTNVLT